MDEGAIIGEGCLHNGPPVERTSIASFSWYYGQCSEGQHYFQGACTDIDECYNETSSSVSFRDFRLHLPASCENECINTYGSYQCTCVTGYTLENDGKTCNDDNECRVRNGGCSHVCINMPGTYQCQCPNSAFTMLADNKTCKAQELHLVCHHNYMEVTFERKVVFGMSDKNLHLIDPACKAEGNWTHVTLKAPLTGCGTTHNSSAGHIHYYNKVINNIVVGSGVITRTQDVEISFKCSYIKSGNASSGGVQPWNRKSTQETSDYGRFTYFMDLFPSSEYQKAYEDKQFPLTVTLDDRLFAQVTVQSNGSDLLLFLDSCRATPSADPYDYPRYSFLESGCSNDATLKYDYKLNSYQQFSIQAFRFIGNYPLVYLHCEMLVCRQNNLNSRCRRGCLPNAGRRRREIKEGSDKTALTFGPVMLDKTSKIPEKSPTEGTSKTLFPAVIGGVSAFAGLLFIALIVLYVRRRKPTQNDKLKTADNNVELHMGSENEAFEKERI